ncbi:MAG: hypothetical protein QG636_744 [Patescibacteria group bacterium]|nr:hypothetical protein [Patescibacteria group bacterium]
MGHTTASSVTIKRVAWLSKDAREARVLITDGKHELECFAQPFTGALGDVVQGPILVLDCDRVEKVDAVEMKTQKLDDHFAYSLTLKVKDSSTSTLLLGDIEILARNCLPADIADGDFVNLTCSRLDL